MSKITAIIISAVQLYLYFRVCVVVVISIECDRYGKSLAQSEQAKAFVFLIIAILLQVAIIYGL